MVIGLSIDYGSANFRTFPMLIIRFSLESWPVSTIMGAAEASLCGNFARALFACRKQRTMCANAIYCGEFETVRRAVSPQTPSVNPNDRPRIRAARPMPSSALRRLSHRRRKWPPGGFGPLRVGATQQGARRAFSPTRVYLRSIGSGSVSRARVSSRTATPPRNNRPM